MPLTAPQAPGRYTAYFRLQAPPTSTSAARPPRDLLAPTTESEVPAPLRFGHRLWADVFVELPVGAPSLLASGHTSPVVGPAAVSTTAAQTTATQQQQQQQEEDAEVAAALSLSAGGSLVPQQYVTVAGGNSNAGAVFAALAGFAASSPSSSSTAATSTASEGSNGTVATAEAPSAAAATAPSTSGSGAAPPGTSSAPGPVGDAAALAWYTAAYPNHLSVLASMGFTDTARNGALLVKYGGVVARVVADLLDTPQQATQQ